MRALRGSASSKREKRKRAGQNNDAAKVPGVGATTNTSSVDAWLLSSLFRHQCSIDKVESVDSILFREGIISHKEWQYLEPEFQSMLLKVLREEAQLSIVDLQRVKRALDDHKDTTIMTTTTSLSESSSNMKIPIVPERTSDEEIAKSVQQYQSEHPPDIQHFDDDKSSYDEEMSSTKNLSTTSNNLQADDLRKSMRNIWLDESGLRSFLRPKGSNSKVDSFGHKVKFWFEFSVKRNALDSLVPAHHQSLWYEKTFKALANDPQAMRTAITAKCEMYVLFSALVLSALLGFFSDSNSIHSALDGFIWFLVETVFFASLMVLGIYMIAHTQVETLPDANLTLWLKANITMFTFAGKAVVAMFIGLIVLLGVLVWKYISAAFVTVDDDVPVGFLYLPMISFAVYAAVGVNILFFHVNVASRSILHTGCLQPEPIVPLDQVQTLTPVQAMQALFGRGHDQRWRWTEESRRLAQPLPPPSKGDALNNERQPPPELSNILSSAPAVLF